MLFAQMWRANRLRAVVESMPCARCAGSGHRDTEGNGLGRPAGALEGGQYTLECPVFLKTLECAVFLNTLEFQYTLECPVFLNTLECPVFLPSNIHSVYSTLSFLSFSQRTYNQSNQSNAHPVCNL